MPADPTTQRSPPGCVGPHARNRLYVRIVAVDRQGLTIANSGGLTNIATGVPRV